MNAFRSEFRYSEADRCTYCDYRAVLPRKVDGDPLVRYSGGQLRVTKCPVGNGWHLSYPAAESGQGG